MGRTSRLTRAEVRGDFKRGRYPLVHMAKELELGQVYPGLQDRKPAENQFEAALLVQPDNREAQFPLGRAQIASGKFREAVGQLESLSKSQPDNADVFALLAQGYYGLGRKQEAERAESRAKLRCCGKTNDPEKRRCPSWVDSGHCLS